MLDLREDAEHYQRTDEMISASKFKKMPKETWDNIVYVTSSVKPNQGTEHPIEISPPTTIHVYSNIIPKKQQLSRKSSSSFLSQSSANNNVGPYSSNPFFSQNMMMNPATSSPLMFSQPNYLSMIAAAQAIANLTPNYNNNNMFVPGFTSPISPFQQQLMMSSPVQNLELQNSQSRQQQQQTQQHNQIKRKPVQLNRKPSNNHIINPKLEQRILQKKSSYQVLQQPVIPQVPNIATPANSQTGSPLSPQKAIKKKVSFNETLKVHKYEHMLDEETDLLEEEKEEENKQQTHYCNDDFGIDYSGSPHDTYNYLNSNLPLRKYSSNNKLFDSRHQHELPYWGEEGDALEGGVWKRSAFLKKTWLKS